jgi:ADP-ribose pyrophosphatase
MAKENMAKENMAKEKSAKKAKPEGLKTETPVKQAKKKASKAAAPPETAQVLSSTLQYDGPLFKVFSDRIIEPNGVESTRDVIRHNGSVVVLAVDDSKSKRDPLIVMERQYRHAAGQYLWELPAGKIDGDETRLAAAKRELIEETGYRAKKWTPLVRYFASPGFLGEWMQIFLAEKLTLGDAQPEDDERIDLYLVSLSEVLRLIDAGAILDGKTLVGVQFYARLLKAKKR